MWKDMVGIIKTVHVKQPDVEALKRAIVSSANHQAADEMLDDMRPEENSPVDCREYNAFYSLCKACVYYESGLSIALENALTAARDAIENYRCSGDVYNEGVGYRLLGIIYHKLEKTNQAITKLERAISLFEQAREVYERKPDYHLEGECARQIRECTSAIKNIKDGSRTAPKSPSRSTDATPPWQPACLKFLVYDFGHASRIGKYVLDDEPISEIEIGEVVIDGKRHKIYAAQEGNYEITLTSGGNYHWLCVVGNSMNQASPTAISPNDYVLVDTKRNANIGDIVVASLNNPPTPAERAGVIKRFEKEFLKSESSEEIPHIPITEIKRINGVVIAVAKPV